MRGPPRCACPGAEAAASAGHHLLTLAAPDERALRRLAARAAAAAAGAGDAGEACRRVGRLARPGPEPPHRLALVASSAEAAAERLAAFGAGGAPAGLARGVAAGRPRVAMLATGQGAQRPGMGRRLHDVHPGFRRLLAGCAAWLGPLGGRDPLELMFEGDAALLRETRYTQPLLVAIEYALGRFWQEWGVEPEALMGYSVGEYAAAALAGAIDPAACLRLVARRGALTQDGCPAGMMAVLSAGEEEVRLLTEGLDGQVSIAAHNGPATIVLSGSPAAIERVLGAAAERDLMAVPLAVSHAFHSALVEPILDEFEAAAREVASRAPRVGLVTNLTGRFLEPGEAPDAAHWRRHFREPVRFADGMRALAGRCDTFLEIGPQPALLGMGMRCLRRGRHRWLASLRRDDDDWRVVLQSAAELYVAGLRAGARPSQERPPLTRSTSPVT